MVSSFRALQTGTVAFGAVDVEVYGQGLISAQRMGPVHAGVKFLPVVFYFRVVEAGSELWGPRVDTTDEVSFLEAYVVARKARQYCLCRFELVQRSRRSDRLRASGL